MFRSCRSLACRTGAHNLSDFEKLMRLEAATKQNVGVYLEQLVENWSSQTSATSRAHVLRQVVCQSEEFVTASSELAAHNRLTTALTQKQKQWKALRAEAQAFRLFRNTKTTSATPKELRDEFQALDEEKRSELDLAVERSSTPAMAAPGKVEIASNPSTEEEAWDF